MVKRNAHFPPRLNINAARNYAQNEAAMRRLIQLRADRGVSPGGRNALMRSPLSANSYMYSSPRSARSVTRTAVATKRKTARVRSIGYGNAWKKVKRVKALNGRPKVGKKFRKKVEKVLDYDKPYGIYTYISDSRLWQQTRDEWCMSATDNNSKPWDQFTPIQIWDAASILWNEKSPSNNWEADTAQGATHNIRYKQPVHVMNSYTQFEFKSTSSHVVNVEMYICTPKCNEITDLPSTLVTNSANQVNNAYYYLNNANAVTAGTFNMMLNEGATNGFWSQLHKQFKVIKVTLKFNPGEHKKHFLQGPKNWTVDGTKYATDAGTSLGTARFQKQIFFRTINDPTVNGINGGAQTDCISRWPSNSQGGVAIRQKRVYRLRLPDNTEFNTLAKSGDLKQNTIKIGHWVRNSDHDVDQQVCVENPVTLANTIVPQ